MNERPDSELLREFARDRSEAAFGLLTKRHADLVFGTAVRRVGDRGAAEEITQSVFLALARKAVWLQHEGCLAAWLHRTAVLESRQWWRGEHRRRQREQAAAELETTMKTSNEGSTAVSEALDEALLQLREGDRQAVLLRFFEGRNHREIGATLGTGEDAARKRVNRALEQITAFLRRRGFAVSSATVATSIEASAHTAPAGLSAAAARGALSACGTASPWLITLLGVGKTQMAGLCLAALLIPVAWQQARLVAAKGEQRRVEALLALLQSQRAGVADELSRIQSQIVQTESEIGARKPGADAPVDGVEAALFRWNEQLDYVRVPKAVLDDVTFDGSQDRWGLHSGSRETLDKERGRISPTILGALGLNDEQQAGVQDVFSRHLKAYRNWAETNSYLTDFTRVGETLPPLPNGRSPIETLIHNSDTRVWLTPDVADADNSWRRQFEKELATWAGEERGALLIRMASDDGSLAACLRQFGAQAAFVVVTPNADGGFWLSQNSDGNWLFNTPVSFSEVLKPGASEAFDEAAERAEITRRVQERRAQFPNEEIPPIENIIEEHRRSWRVSQQARNGGVVQLVLGRSLPPPLCEYLSQWRAAHPDVPDAPKQHPQTP